MDKKKCIYELKIAELQFRLAATVHLAVTLDNLELEFHTEWTHGRHTVNYEELYLTRHQSDIAANYLKQTATYLMAITIRNALKGCFQDSKNNEDKNIVAAYQISRLIRNAFAHSPIRPIWHIDEDCRDKKYEIDEIISLNTKNLDKKPFDWRHYGGLLALFRLSKFVRIDILGDIDVGKNRSIPQPKRRVIQQGELVLAQVEKIPEGARKIFE